VSPPSEVVRRSVVVFTHTYGKRAVNRKSLTPPYMHSTSCAVPGSNCKHCLGRPAAKSQRALYGHLGHPAPGSGAAPSGGPHDRGGSGTGVDDAHARTPGRTGDPRRRADRGSRASLPLPRARMREGDHTARATALGVEMRPPLVRLRTRPNTARRASLVRLVARTIASSPTCESEDRAKRPRSRTVRHLQAGVGQPPTSAVILMPALGMV
jgi:hypothetical protein